MSPEHPASPTILVVDDDPGQRQLVAGYLRQQGYPVLLAASGEEALASLGAQPVGMMISDVRMPGMTGLQLLRGRARRIRRCPCSW